MARPVVVTPGKDDDVANPHGSRRAIFDYTIGLFHGQRALTPSLSAQTVAQLDDGTRDFVTCALYTLVSH
jgi:hypothetical protein